jgi:hypothetical protein
MAEVYWDMEWTLQQQGCDYAYDKRLYDRLRDHHARPVREHFLAGLDYQNKLARFLENHDEPRAAATFPPGIHEAAAAITFLSPGLRFFHQRQFEGRKKRISPHLGRAPEEPVDDSLNQFYDRLLGILRQPAFRDGNWQLLQCDPAWDGNWTNDCFVAFAWEGPCVGSAVPTTTNPKISTSAAPANKRWLVAVNYSPNQAQCRVRLPIGDLTRKTWRLQDHLSSATYDRDGDELQSSGLYLDMAPWQPCVFSLMSVASK